jgi:hypothetical protein
VDAARLDALARTIAAAGTRRRLLAGLALLGLGGALARPGAARARDIGDCIIPSCRPHKCDYDEKDVCIRCYCTNARGTGVAGGGEVELGEERRAQFSLLATRAPHPAEAGLFEVVGHLRWVEPAWEGVGLNLQSVLIAGYGPAEDDEDARELFGWLEASALAAVVPFYLRVVAGGVGRGAARLAVGDAVTEALVRGATAEPSGFAYDAEGALASGDLALLELAAGDA